MNSLNHVCIQKAVRIFCCAPGKKVPQSAQQYHTAFQQDSLYPRTNEEQSQTSTQYHTIQT